MRLNAFLFKFLNRRNRILISAIEFAYSPGRCLVAVDIYGGISIQETGNEVQSQPLLKPVATAAAVAAEIVFGVESR